MAHNKNFREPNRVVPEITVNGYVIMGALEDNMDIWGKNLTTFTKFTYRYKTKRPKQVSWNYFGPY